MSSIIANSLNDLKQAAQDLKAAIVECKIICFYGEMGAGKTSFISALCKSLGSNNEVSSPTYALINEYNYPDGIIYHFDLFRLKSMQELLDIGFEEYLYRDSICLIEWPQLAEPLLESGLKIEIEKMTLNQRKISTFKF